MEILFHGIPTLGIHLYHHCPWGIVRHNIPDFRMSAKLYSHNSSQLLRNRSFIIQWRTWFACIFLSVAFRGIHFQRYGENMRYTLWGIHIILYVSDHLHKTKGTQEIIIANTRHHSSIRQTIHRQPHWHNCGDMSDEECNIRRHERNLYRDQQVAQLAVYETKASHLHIRKGWFTQHKQHIYEPIIKGKRLSRWQSTINGDVDKRPHQIKLKSPFFYVKSLCRLYDFSYLCTTEFKTSNGKLSMWAISKS